MHRRIQHFFLLFHFWVHIIFPFYSENCHKTRTLNLARRDRAVKSVRMCGCTVLCTDVFARLSWFCIWAGRQQLGGVMCVNQKAPPPHHAEVLIQPPCYREV